VHVLSVEDGALLQQVRAGAYVPGSVALAGGHAFFGHYGNKLMCADVGQGRVVWSYEDAAAPAAFFASPAVTADKVVIGSRDWKVHAVDRKTGKKVWTFATKASVDSSPVICGERVAVGSDDGRVYLLNLADGREDWSYEIGAPVRACPAVAGGWLIVGAEDGGVYAFGARRETGPRSEGP